MIIETNTDKPMFNVVLVEPEIPSNTGNIGRTCVGTNSSLHLIEPLGFELSDKRVKRAGLDYWPNLDLHIHADFSTWFEKVPDKTRIFYLSTKAKKTIYDMPFQQGDWVVFGKETKGLPEELIFSNESQALTIPHTDKIRSFNLANSVGMVLSEGMRQIYRP
ncbi:MAG: tRNA (cytidine(34)-2'-O)-methyltransferase [Bdellovibrionales bacterium]